ncbi:hypothetical protein DITRI_Ditri03aG0028600 [Diplodiscus trichospermus]
MIILFNISLTKGNSRAINRKGMAIDDHEHNSTRTKLPIIDVSYFTEKARMDMNRLQQEVACMRSSLFDQGYLDEQFIQLEELQDDANPNFVQEIVTLFYTDSARLIQNIEQALRSKPIGFSKLDDYMHQFKGSSSSIGAKKVTNQCALLREYCSAENGEGCISTFLQVKQEYAILRRKLEAYFEV